MQKCCQKWHGVLLIDFSDHQDNNVEEELVAKDDHDLPLSKVDQPLLPWKLGDSNDAEVVRK